MQAPVHLLFLLCPNRNFEWFPHQRSSDFFWSSFLVNHDFLGIVVGLWLLSTTIFSLPQTVWTVHRISPWLVEGSKMINLHTLYGMLETRFLRSSCSEGQQEFNCQNIVQVLQPAGQYMWNWWCHPGSCGKPTVQVPFTGLWGLPWHLQGAKVTDVEERKANLQEIWLPEMCCW